MDRRLLLGPERASTKSTAIGRGAIEMRSHQKSARAFSERGEYARPAALAQLTEWEVALDTAGTM